MELLCRSFEGAEEREGEGETNKIGMRVATKNKTNAFPFNLSFRRTTFNS